MIDNFQNLTTSNPFARLVVAVIGTILMRFPHFTFQFGVANLQQKALWDHDFNIACISDCRVYGELSMGIDLPGHFKWTYFPVWPNLIRFFKNLLPFEISGYSAAVILSWIVSVVAGVLILWFFDQYWPDPKSPSQKDSGLNQKIFGFSKKAWVILFLFSIYPHGHFWLQGYSEPLFISILLLGLLSVINEKWILAGILIGFSAIVRPQGVWLPPIWTILLVLSALRGTLSWNKAIFGSAFSFLGALGLIVWYWKGTGDPLYYYKIQSQSGYGRSFNLWNGLWNHRPQWESSVLYFYLSLIGSFQLIKKKDFSSRLMGWFSLAFTEVPLFFGGFYSYVRFLSICPAFFVLLTEQFEKSKFREAIIIVFFISKLAIHVYKSGYHEWVG